jgi:hypothetical protein
MKRHGVSQVTWSKKPLYCRPCAEDAAKRRTDIEKAERSKRIATGNAKDCDILQGLAEDLREWVARRLEDAGHITLAQHVSETPIIMNSQYRRILGRAWYGSAPLGQGGSRRIEWSLAAYQNVDNVSHGFFKRTLLHEWAHILDHASHGFSSRHGRGWRQWTAFLGIPDAKAHSETYGVSRYIKRYELTKDMSDAVDNDRETICS